MTHCSSTNHQSTETRPNLPQKNRRQRDVTHKEVEPGWYPTEIRTMVRTCCKYSRKQLTEMSKCHRKKTWDKGVSDSTWWNPCIFFVQSCSVTHWARTQFNHSTANKSKTHTRCRPLLVIVGLLTAVRAYLPELQLLFFWVQLSQRPWASTCRDCWHFKVTN